MFEIISELVYIINEGVNFLKSHLVSVKTYDFLYGFTDWLAMFVGILKLVC